MSVAAWIVALAVVLPTAAAAQDARQLAEAIAAGVMTYSDESMPTVLCIRLLGPDGQDMAVPRELPGLVEHKVFFARGGSPTPKILGGCGGGFGADGGEGSAASGLALTASVLEREDQTAEVRIHLPGPGLGTSLICSVPEDLRVTIEIQSACSPRAR